MHESVKTYEIKETDYYSKLTEEQKADIEFFMEWLQYVEIVQFPGIVNSTEKESPRIYRGRILGGS